VRYNDMRLFVGSASAELGKEICEHLGILLGEISIRHFSDGEIGVQIKENIRGSDVFMINSTSPPGNDHLVELLIMIDAAKRASARRLTAVLPYYGYGRQDRKDKPRVAITAKLVANLLVAAGADRVLTIDLHAGQIQGFFDIPVDNLYAMPLIIEYFRKRKLERPVVVSPDLGSVKRSRAFARAMNAPLAIIEKRRPRPNEAKVLNIIGQVEGCTAVLIDDMIDTAGTLVGAAEALMSNGAESVLAAATHPVLSGRALTVIKESPIREIVVTNTIMQRSEIRDSRIEVMSVAGLLGEAIQRIHNGESVSVLFDIMNDDTDV